MIVPGQILRTSHLQQPLKRDDSVLTSMGSSFRIPHIRTTGRNAAAAYYKDNAHLVNQNPLLYKSINEMTARASVFRKSHY